MSLVYSSGQEAASVPTVDGEWTEGQFEALVTLHMLQPGRVLTEDDCWAIEYTRRQADAVENNAVDAFDEGRKYGILSVAGKSDAQMFAEVERLRMELAVAKALRRYDDARAADLSARLKSAAETVMRYEPLHGITGVHGDEDVWGEVEEASALASMVLDEVLPLLAAEAADATNKLAGYEAEGRMNPTPATIQEER